MTDELPTERKRAETEAYAQLESIRELVQAYDKARLEGVGDDAALEAIHEDPLSISVRSGWTYPGDPFEPAEYEILLSWGGPASRITGELEHEQPEGAVLEYQD
jgi:hypothetical protein